MSTLTIDRFAVFFAAVHGHEPFPWQSMLLEHIASSGRWPDVIDLPTAHGKTACMDVALYALVMGLPTPRRIWFVVDRRIVVDEAYRRADRIAMALGQPTSGIVREVADYLKRMSGSEHPLQIGRLRGGARRKVAWSGNPAQPTVITSTIDQIGSRLLFRGYGVSDHRAPMEAALACNDSLILLDEAHIAQPFQQTVKAVARFRENWAEQPLRLPFQLVTMSATPPPIEEGEIEPVTFPESDVRTKALDHPILNARRAVAKPAELAMAKKPAGAKGNDELVLDAVERAAGFVRAGRKRIAIMVNRVRTAKEIEGCLRHYEGMDASIQLITGRMRPIDRDNVIKEWDPILRTGAKDEPPKPTVIVTTQCLEVGADFSFDALITECASLDALRQRFGRLARDAKTADATGAILIRKSDAAPKEPDPIYGSALAATWRWLNEHADASGDKPLICMGIDALAPKLSGNLSECLAMPRRAPLLMPAYLDLLSQTSPRPAIEPDIALFIRGIPPEDSNPRAEVQVLWRTLDSEEQAALVEGLPPLRDEMVQVSLSELRRVLAGEEEVGEDADTEGGFEPSKPTRRSALPSVTTEPLVIYRGKQCLPSTTRLDDIRPNDVIVLAAPTDGTHPVSFQRLLTGTPLNAEVDVYVRAYERTHGARRLLWRADADTVVEDEDAVIEQLLANVPQAERAGFARRRLIEYAPGHFHLTAKPPVEPVAFWESDVDEDDQLVAARIEGLGDHTRAVSRATEKLAKRTSLPAELITAALTASDLHDIGKCDERFQFVLGHGRRVGLEDLLAKSACRLGPAREKQLLAASRLPHGFRHELLSMQMAMMHLPHDEKYRDLILHLIASHHGHCRPFAPIIEDDSPGPASCPADGRTLHISPEQRRDCPPHRLDSGVAERFWRLTRRYGWWGLAYLETLIRAADIHASRVGEEDRR